MGLVEAKLAIIPGAGMVAAFCLAVAHQHSNVDSVCFQYAAMLISARHVSWCEDGHSTLDLSCCMQRPLHN